MRKEYLLSIGLIIVAWYLFAMLIANDIILPNPKDVFFTCFYLLTSVSFYQIILTSILRVFKGYVLSFIIALVLAIIADEYSGFKRFMEPIEHLLKSIPNISYIILSLIWVGQEKGVILVIFLVSFPLLYTQLLQGLSIKQQELKDVCSLYEKSKIDSLFHVKLPMALPMIFTSISTTLGLCFKVGITAEILNQTPNGIGYQLYKAKANLAMIDLFAWTIWIIIISYIIYRIVIYFVNLTTKKWTV
ncbi:MAG: hypothetical protein R3Y57_06895 [Erysipelotrichaceae bacterium]